MAESDTKTPNHALCPGHHLHSASGKHSVGQKRWGRTGQPGELVSFPRPTLTEKDEERRGEGVEPSPSTFPCSGVKHPVKLRH